MNERAKAWVDALGHNAYGQTHGQLVYSGTAKPSGYCCLGVACRLSDDYVQMDEYFLASDGTVARSLLPHDVADELGIRKEARRAGVAEGVDVRVRLTLEERRELQRIASRHLSAEAAEFGLSTLNDAGVSFPQIAKILRNHAEEVFE